MNFRAKSKPESVGFQIAPMIDVVFLLLFFFMTSQLFSQWESQIDLQLPSSDTAEQRPRAHGEIILNVMPNGDVTVHGETLQPDAIRNLLGRLVQQYPGQPVLIRADERTPYRELVKVMDLCRIADVWNLSFAVLQSGETGTQGLTP